MTDKYKTTTLVSGDELRNAGYQGFVCPWCSRSTVGRTPNWAAECSWVYMPFLLKEPKYRCEGCWWVVGEACVSADFDHIADRDWVQRAANTESSSVTAFRLSLVRQRLIDLAENHDLSATQRKLALEEVRAAIHSLGY